jgi:hypothetical protein
VAVLPQVLAPVEVASMQDGAWQTLEHIGKHCTVSLKRDFPDSWRSYLELLPMHSMLMQHHQVGHAQFVWDVRQNAKVVDVFAKLWRCERRDLLTSFDGLAMHLPPETTNRGWFRQMWMQKEHHFLLQVQSLIVSLNANAGEGTQLERAKKYATSREVVSGIDRGRTWQEA